ncbi:MAG: Xaa-Pro peptidase family protein [Phycisphaerales bacterium]
MSTTTSTDTHAVAPALLDACRTRLSKLRVAAGKHNAAAFLVSHPSDVAYLTGFLGGDSYLIVPTDASARPLLISDFRYAEELEAHRPLCDLFMREKTMTQALKSLLPERVKGLTAVQGDHLTYSEFDTLAEAVGRASLVPTSSILLKLRAVKDAIEVENIRRAIDIQQKALLEVLPTVRPGRTELDVAAQLEAEMKRRGSVNPGFPSIVAAQANGSLPHYSPGPVEVKAHMPLLIDWGAQFNGYRSDMTRTFTLARWPEQVREIYPIVLEAYQKSAAALAPGKSGAEIDAVARDVITKAGFGDKFGHGLGHGIGLAIHEEPRLSHRGDASVLEPGNVVTVEPGIYLPGVGGVRLEDDYLITPTGAERLNSLPMDIQWATLG